MPGLPAMQPSFSICLWTHNEIAYSPIIASRAQPGPRGAAIGLAAPGGAQSYLSWAPFFLRLPCRSFHQAGSVRHESGEVEVRRDVAALGSGFLRMRPVDR